MTAAIGFGTQFAIGDGAVPEVFTDVAEVMSITPPNFSADAIDVTTNDSPTQFREYIQGLKGAGEVSFEMLYTPDAADAMLAAFNAGLQNYRITFTNAVTVVFAGVMTGYSPSAPMDDAMKASVTLQVSGEPAYA